MFLLYPPFFNVPESHSFSQGWEEFCCKLLNLAEGTAQIEHRSYWDGGVDLYDPKRKIAFQCKSIKSGRAGDFNLTAIGKSYEDAKRNQGRIGWEKYAVCINVDLTGRQLDTFRETFPDVEIFTASYWLSLCHRFETAVRGDFRHLIQMPRDAVIGRLEDSLLNYRLTRSLKSLNLKYCKILFYTNLHNTIYEIEVPSNLTIRDLKLILLKMYKFPNPVKSSNGVRFSLRYHIYTAGKVIPEKTKISEIQFTTEPFLTLLATFRCEDTKGYLIGIKSMCNPSHEQTLTGYLSPEGRRDMVVFEKAVEAAVAEFHLFLQKLLSHGDKSPLPIVYKADWDGFPWNELFD